MKNTNLNQRCEEIASQLMNMALTDMAADVRQLIAEFNRIEAANYHLAQAVALMVSKEAEG